MIVRPAVEQDAPGFIALAGQVEHWFGPMADEPAFRAALQKHIRRATALAAAEGPACLAACFSAQAPRPITCAGSWSPSTHAARASAVPW